MEDLNDIFEVSVTSDHLQVTLKQLQPFPEELNFEGLQGFIKECGITYGLNEDVLNQILTEETKLPAVVATGTEPIAGKDAYIWSILDKVINENVDEEEDDSKDVNLRNVIEIPSVETGTVVGEKVNATEEKRGMTVYGETIPAKPGRDIKLRPGKNTRISKDGLKVIATIDGQVSVEPKVIHVFPMYEVHGDLDLHVGNIDFIGNVNIRGNVPSGFEVKAKGDIRVHGSVESAYLYSEGSIYIQQGVVAQNTGLIEAKESVKVGFLNQANIIAGGDVSVTKSILHSNIDAEGHVICKQGKGNIVGGTISSGKGIEVNEVGNHMSTPTKLFLGISERVIKSEKKYKKVLNETQLDVQKLAVLLKSLTEKEKKSSLTGKEKIMKLRIQNSLIEANNHLNNAKDKLLDLEEMLENYESAEIRVYRTIYSNTDLHFGKYRRKIVTKYDHVLFKIDRSEIKFESL